MDFEIHQITSKAGRKVNEDYASFEINKEGCCCVVADGLGGHCSGEVASSSAVNKILSSYKSKVYDRLEYLGSYLQEAQKEVLSIQNKELRFKKMRTTLVLLLIEDYKAEWAHIGDSRLYFFRDDKIIFQTKDHSVTQALVNAGEITSEEIRFHEDRNRLLRVLGDWESFKPKIEATIELKSGDKFLLCTDGFWEHILEEEMEKTVCNCDSAKQWLVRMEKLLDSKIEENNDNYTAVAVFVL